jgi:hypothetical protein
MEFRRATKADVEAFVDIRIEFVTQIRTMRTWTIFAPAR